MRHRYLAALALAAMTVHAADPEDETDIEEITVVATRARQRVRDQPVRVEVVAQEELEESQTVAPGDLTNLLNETAPVGTVPVASRSFVARIAGHRLCAGDTAAR